MNEIHGRQITPIDARGVPRIDVPYVIYIEPPAQVAAAQTTTVIYTVGESRTFVWTHLGFSSQAVGVPAAGQPFKVLIQDLGMSQRFGAQRWLMRPLIGSNPALSDSPAIELPRSWDFTPRTSIQVEFENFGTLPCTPYLVMLGYLD